MPRSRSGATCKANLTIKEPTVAQIRPFAGIRYAHRKELDLSRLIAPPYDVLDEAGKAALQTKHPNNVVTIDLPHLPPKTVGPDETYAKANTTFQAWMHAGVLHRDSRPAIYPYMQSYEHAGRSYHRRGFIALVKLEPFGAGDIVPHEKTYKGPIEDRMKLMRATGMQLSPIFGLFPDARNEVTNLLYKEAGRPQQSATLDGVKNDLWSVIDAEVENQVIDLMKSRKIYIADGHHRYTTALQFQHEQEQLAGGKLPAAHPANWCMFVLVGMQDPGLLILPTHRLIGGIESFDMEVFWRAIANHVDVTETPLRPDQIDELADVLAQHPVNTFGLYDARKRKAYTLKVKNPDLLASLESNQSAAWRQLDVAILQRYLLDEVIQPQFGGGKEIVKGYTANAHEVVPMCADGAKYQIALLLRPTPLHALEELGQHGEVMPQKSTYFFPKLATGMVINPLR